MPANRVDDHKHSAGVGIWVAWALGALAVLVQMVTNGRYGYFRDEFYFLAARDHLAFGYVDFAPLIAWLTHASRVVLGDSLHVIRLLPALAFGAEVVLSGFITRELGGRGWGMLLACLSVLTAPVILGNATRLLPPLPFIRQQIMMLNPMNALVWMAGLVFLLFHRDGKRYRVLGLISKTWPKLKAWD